MKVHRNVIRVVLLMALAVYLAGCTPSKEIPFETLETSHLNIYSLTGAEFLQGTRLARQDFFAVASEAEALWAAATLFSSEDELQLRAFDGYDFDQSFALIAYYGIAGSTGYNIEIVEVQARQHTVDVVVQTLEPCQNIPDIVLGFLKVRPCTIIAGQLITYPGHIISINYADLPTTGVLTFNFRVNGELVKIIERELPPPAGE